MATTAKKAPAKKAAAKKTTSSKTSVADQNREVEAAKRDQQEINKSTTDQDVVKAAVAEVEKDHKGSSYKDPVEALDEAKKNDEKFDPNNISVTHDEVVREKLAHAGTPEAREQAEKNYLLQQERQAQLERDTQKGLGFNGVRDDKDKKKDVLAS